MDTIVQAHPIPVLECRNLSISYMTRAGEVPAVVDFNLSLMPGEAHGLVGESGCGKSTIARLAVGLYEPSDGDILFENQVLSNARAQPAMRRRMNMIVQDPYASVNPRGRVR